MKKILKIVLLLTVCYHGINWIADNPKSVSQFRVKMNYTVGYPFDYTIKKTNEKVPDAVKNSEYYHIVETYIKYLDEAKEIK